MNAQLTPVVEHYRQLVDQFIMTQLDQLPDDAEQLKGAMRHSILLGGKRIRPLLVYLTAGLTQTPSEKLAHPAAAVEAIHAYSLVHDDLPSMDDDNLRRGQPTCHIAYGEATATLAGDALQSWAFYLLSHAEQFSAATRLSMLQELSQAAGYHGMCAGQSIDVSSTNQHQTLAQLEQMHRLKTGALIRAAVRLGAYAGNINDPAQLNALDRYANAIGLAFQVRDDVLDVIADTDVIGKPQGSDIEHHKNTYPLLLGLEQAQEKCQQLLEEALDALNCLPYPTEQLAALALYVVQRNK